MSSLARRSKRAVGISGKVDADCDKLGNHFARASYHTFNCVGVVQVMTCTHSVVEVRLVIVLALQHTYSALCKITVALLGRALADYKYLFILRQVKSGKKSGNARTDDNNVVFIKHSTDSLQQFFFRVNYSSLILPTFPAKCGFDKIGQYIK